MLRIALALLILGTTARAEVADSSAAGFTVRETTTVNAPATKAWAMFVEHVGTWWSKEHTWSGDNANLSIDPRPGGCFCEKLGADGATHMTVILVDRNKVLRMTGGLGPLQELPVTGVMTVKLTEVGQKTTVELTYRVGGYAPGGLAALAKPVDGVLAAQLARYHNLVDTGKP